MKTQIIILLARPLTRGGQTAKITKDNTVPQQIRFKSGNCVSAPISITVMRPKASSSGPKATGNLCSGVVYKDVLEVSNTLPGALVSWLIRDIDNNSIGTSITEGSDGRYTLTAGIVAGRAVRQDIILKSGDCVSYTLLPITVS